MSPTSGPAAVTRSMSSTACTVIWLVIFAAELDGAPVADVAPMVPGADWTPAPVANDVPGETGSVAALGPAGGGAGCVCAQAASKVKVEPISALASASVF